MSYGAQKDYLFLALDARKRWAICIGLTLLSQIKGYKYNENIIDF